MLFLEILLYVLGSILLVVLIILGIKLIASVDRINVLLDSVEKKMKTVDEVFNVIDKVVDSFVMISDRTTDFLSSLVSKLFTRKKTNCEKVEENV